MREVSVRVILVRHGQSASNAGLASQHPATIPLTELGQAQALHVARELDQEPDLIVSSHYLRAKATAGPLIARYPATRVEEWPVHEFTFLPHQAYDGTTTSERRAAVQAYWQAAKPHRVIGEGAESFAAFVQRVHSVRKRLEAHQGGLVVVFSHKKFLSCLLWTWLVGPLDVSSKRMGRFHGFDRGLGLGNAARIEVRLGTSVCISGIAPCPLVDTEVEDAP